jgi:Anti-sigma-K factor rskA/Putative zinc-finger
LSPTEPHDEFLELCAVSTSGELTEEEHEKLQEHLAICESCRKVLRQYEAVVGQAIPALAANQEFEREEFERAESDSSWSSEQAEKAFFQRLAQADRHTPNQFKGASDLSTDLHRIPPLSSRVAWRQVWMLYAAGILLFLTLGSYIYRVSVRPGRDVAQRTPSQPDKPNQASIPANIEEQLSDTGHEREITHAQIEQRDRTIAVLHHQLAQQSVEIDLLKADRGRLENELRAGNASKQELMQKGTDLGQKLDAAQTNSSVLQGKLDALAQESANDVVRAKALETKASDLTRLLQDRETTLEQQEQLLAHDRDIRELMGARDLYIAEVYDVARTGETKKPYGRVFYTRGKSLIFYAYDLDQQTEAKKANTFQAWGRRGPDQQQAVNLGVFYEDSASRKRWILKCDDPKTLAQIDGVFVTVEPNGGSHKPSGKSLLFAYLRVDPNHP